MSESKYTPGPWQHAIAGPNHWIAAGDRKIAFIGGSDSIFTVTPNTPHAANAHLIAAAPELLEACKAMVNGRVVLGDDWPEVVNARAAIAKAEIKP